ncbi:hypothetical protein GQ43DRAFT_394407 [Delitschia confertaspora ATCC 74209]|uniref:ER membrane protein complex subunit 2 n=1 Tax=Delitschia confertaspora ATCC 74209 TaxID=1513339 RepID=A0A9P4JL56_9PLEO|nr:hypothetical protein GQ43DRAFT_394407 [Delitschia confertaspora ATCC 74209]
MSQPNLLTPPAHISPQSALHLSQKAPLILSKPPTSSLPWPLSLLSSSESPETWTTYENLFYTCLQTGDDASARQILSFFSNRFSETNERVIVLRGLYEELQARNKVELEAVLKKYNQLISEDPTRFLVRKRKVAVLKSLEEMEEAIGECVRLVEESPTDVEGWAELGELYKSQNLFPQAIYCLEEVLLSCPNSWGAHATLATLHHLSSSSAPTPSIPSLTLSLRHFCRSIELNDSYLRGFYGLKVLSSELIPLLQNYNPSSRRNQHNDEEDVAPPKLETVKKLEELATGKLGEIVRRYGAGDNGWTGYEESEIAAARKLLDKEGKVVR